MNLLLELVREVRNTRGEFKVDPGKRILALAKAGAAKSDLERYGYIFRRLCNVEELQLLTADDPAPANSASIVVGDTTLYLPLEGMLDLAAERQRLEGEGNRLAQQITKTQKMLNNDSFVSKAPAAIVQRERDRLTDLESAYAQVVERLSNLSQ